MFPGIASGQKAGSRLVNVVPCDSLTVYYPHFTRIDLVTGTMPSKSDEKVIFCCAGSFTGERLTSFKHSNIAGDHVSGGTFHKGYKCGPYNALYCDMGRGWNYSWYRKEDGSVKELFPTPGKYTTNWITFYRE